MNTGLHSVTKGIICKASFNRSKVGPQALFWQPRTNLFNLFNYILINTLLCDVIITTVCQLYVQIDKFPSVGSMKVQSNLI